MVRADTLLCGSQTVVDNMYDVLETETERRLNDDFNAPRMANMFGILIFSWQTKPKAARDPTLFDVCWLLILSPDSWAKKVIMSSHCPRPRAITSLPLQIPNYLTFGPTQVQEIVDTELCGPLPITHVKWYFDTHLHYLKETKGFRPSFVFIDIQPDLVCKIAAIDLACTLLVSPTTVSSFGSTECRISRTTS